MPELTPQDRESYKHLYDAATGLNNLLNHDLLKDVSTLSALKELTNKFSSELPQPRDLDSFGQLQSKVELTGSYLTMYQLFTDVIEGINIESSKRELNTLKTKINEATQKLLLQFNQLKVFLEAVDDDFLEDLTIRYSDPLFLSLLPAGNVKKWTTQLIADQAPALEDDDVQVLINAWRKAVTEFVDDARRKNEENGQLTPGRTETIAHFFYIHEQLEGLYSELSTATALNS